MPTLESVVSDGAKKQRSGTPWWLNLIVFFVALFVVVGVLKMAGLIDFSRSGNSVSQQSSQQAVPANEIVSSEPVAQQAISEPVAETVAQPLTGPEANTGSIAAVEQPQAGSGQVQDSQTPPEPSVETLQAAEIESAAQVTEDLAAGDLSESEASQSIVDETTQELEQKFAAQEAEELAALALQLESQQQNTVQQSTQANSNNAGSNQQQANVNQSSQPQYEEVIHDSLRNISVNVVSYSSDARQRFVMLDLTIYKEGDQLANNAQVVEIIRNGAIVEFQNKRYLLKP